MAVLAETAGRLEQAADLYAAAAQGWDAYGQVLEHALGLFGQARCMARLGRPSAGAALEAASRRLTGLGARRFAAQAARLHAEVARS